MEGKKFNHEGAILAVSIFTLAGVVCLLYLQLKQNELKFKEQVIKHV